jgi:hypothetical protein
MATTIEEAVRAWLLADPVVGSLVGGASQDAATGRWKGQVYKESIPQGATITGAQAAISMKVKNQEREGALVGKTSDMVSTVDLQVESLSESFNAQLVDAILGSPSNPKLDGLTATRLGDGKTWVWCQYCHALDSSDDFVPSPHSADLGTFLRPITLQIAWLSL